MIVESRNSQIEDKKFLPLVLVKNGVMTSMFTDGLIDCSVVSNIKLPNARYDYVLYADFFNEEGYRSSGVAYLVSRKQTNLDININHPRVFLHAELVTTEI